MVTGSKSAAVTLRTAAVLLRELAARATPGPWVARFTDRYGWPITDLDDEDSGTFALVAGTALPREDDRDPGHYDAHHLLAEHDDDLPAEQSRELLASLRWAATVHPGLAESLAALLEVAADAADDYGDLPEFVMFDSTQAPAYRFTFRLIHDGLAVARGILGSTD